MKQIMKINGNFSDVFGENLSPELVQTLFNVYNFREEYRKLSLKEAHVHLHAWLWGAATIIYMFHVSCFMFDSLDYGNI